MEITEGVFHLGLSRERETKGCDGNGATVRVTLCDYKKAFDLIDHRILVNKLCELDLPTEIINWIIDFLSDRSQRIKLSRDVTPSGVQSCPGHPRGRN